MPHAIYYGYLWHVKSITWYDNWTCKLRNNVVIGIRHMAEIRRESGGLIHNARFDLGGLIYGHYLCLVVLGQPGDDREYKGVGECDNIVLSPGENKPVGIKRDDERDLFPNTCRSLHYCTITTKLFSVVILCDQP